MTHPLLETTNLQFVEIEDKERTVESRLSGKQGIIMLHFGSLAQSVSKTSPVTGSLLKFRFIAQLEVCNKTENFRVTVVRDGSEHCILLISNTNTTI